MPEKTNKYLLSDAGSLRRIKIAQFRSQVPALILLALAIAANAVLPRLQIYLPALILALFAVAWYLLVGFSHRFRQRIPLPPPGAVLSPLQGRVAYLRSNGDLTLLGLRKVLLDSVEIRSPHDNCRLEGNVLYLDSLQGTIAFRFNFRKLQWFPQTDHAAGNIIGMAVGAGSCTVSFPGQPELTVSPGATLDAGDVLLRRLETPPRAGITI